MVNTASLDELLKKIEAENGAGWGRWTLNVRARRLYLELDGREPYGIRVEELLHDREVLYILLHLARHLWIDDADLGALVRASNHIRWVCGWED